MYRPNISTVGQLSGLQGIKCCVYGGAGMGKTYLCSTAPSPLIMSAEKGLLSLKKEFSHLPAIEIGSVADLKNMADWITGSAEARQYYTFCLDSITEIAERILDFETGRRTNKLQAYGETQVQVLREFRRFRDLVGPNVYFSAKQERIKEGNGFYFRPWMPGQQLPQAMPYFFDEVFFLGVMTNPQGQKFRYLRTQPDTYIEAKDRSGMLDEYEPPNLSHVFNKMLGVR